MPEKVSVVTLGNEKNLHVYVGRSQFDAPEVDVEACIIGCQAEIGEIHRDRITHAYEYDLSGEAIA
jgi:ribosomal protein S12 methylthiotransferase